MRAIARCAAGVRAAGSQRAAAGATPRRSMQIRAARRAARGYAESADLLLPRRAGRRRARVRAGERCSRHSCGVKLIMYPVAERSAPCRRSSPRARRHRRRLLSSSAGLGARRPGRRPLQLIPQLVVYAHSGVRPRDTLQLESARLAVRAGSPQERILRAPEEHRRADLNVGRDRAEFGGSARGCRLAAGRLRDQSMRASSPLHITCTRMCWSASRCRRSRPVQWIVRRGVPAAADGGQRFLQRPRRPPGELAQHACRSPPGDTRSFDYEESREFQAHVAARLPLLSRLVRAGRCADRPGLAAAGRDRLPGIQVGSARAASGDGARGVMMLTADTAAGDGHQGPQQPASRTSSPARAIWPRCAT